ncbi:MAG: cell division protein FtsQ/DivIB [Specibacter sp.]
MAEPRRPRIISTRPGSAAGPPDPADTGQHAAQESTATARPTSGKVTVTPVPADAATAIPHTRAPQSAAPKTGVPKAPSPKSAPKAAPKAKTLKTKDPKDPKAKAKPSRAGDAAGTSPGGAGGAQVLSFPVPAHKRRKRRVWIGAAGVAVVLVLVMAVALFSPALAVKTIAFDGRKLVPEKTLQAAMAPLLHKPLPQVTQSDVSALLAAVPQVKSSRIESRPPSTLVVHLVERVPVALLKNGAEYLLVDQDGVQLGTTKNQSAAGLPLIDGGKAAIGKDTFSAITAVLATLPQSVLGKMANASAKSPDAVELRLNDGKMVVWGNASDMDLKAQVLEALITAPPPAPTVANPNPAPVNVYDVSAPRHPVTR